MLKLDRGIQTLICWFACTGFTAPAFASGLAASHSLKKVLHAEQNSCSHEMQVGAEARMKNNLGRAEDQLEKNEILLVQAPGDVFVGRRTLAPFGLNTGIPLGPEQRFIRNRDGSFSPYHGERTDRGTINSIARDLRSLNLETLHHARP